MLSPAAEQLYPMFQDALEMLTLTHPPSFDHDLEALNTASALGRSVHKRENELTEGLLAGPPETEPLRFIPSHVERIGDALESVMRCLRTCEDEAAEFTDGACARCGALRPRPGPARVRPRPDAHRQSGAGPPRGAGSHALPGRGQRLRLRPRGRA